ncbi:MAG: Flp pilus assembly protein CpaB [Elusimicrobiota bacterium]|jgi:pilus assembly protein CpaB|nr:Flp pilus assembly protein CpaB [Elusimicrobiota bacterium]
MKNKNIFFPLVIALVAALIYYFVLYMAQGKLRSSQKMERVAVAAVDLPEGRVISRPNIKEAFIPLAFIQKDAYVLSRGANIADIENLVTRVAIAKGNQITKPSIMSLNPEAGISLKVMPNYRAFILGVDNSVSSLIKPGDKVDVLLTFDALLKGGSKEKMTATILQDIPVLGVGSNLGQGMDSASRANAADREANNAAFSDRSVLSLSLSPIEAQYLALAREEGELTVIVRATGDTKVSPIEIASFSKLFN